MKLIRKGSALLLALALALAMAGCDESDTPAADAPDVDVPDADTSMADEPGDEGGGQSVVLEVEMAVEYEDDYTTITIPQIALAEGDELPAGAAQVNDEIMAFCERYEEYIGGHPDEFTCKITHTYIVDETYIQILMHRAYYPSYGTDGDVAIWVYDTPNDRICSTAEMMDIWQADGDMADASIAAGDYLDAPKELVRYDYVGVMRSLDDELVLFYDVVGASVDGDEWKHNYAVLPDGGVVRFGEGTEYLMV